MCDDGGDGTGLEQLRPHHEWMSKWGARQADIITIAYAILIGTGVVVSAVSQGERERGGKRGKRGA